MSETETAWEAECAARERRQGLAIGTIGGVLSLVFLLRDSVVEPDALEQMALGRVIAAVAVFVSVAVIWRRHDLFGVRAGLCVAHFSLVLAGSFMGPTLTQVWPHVIAFSLLIWGPSAIFSWPARFGALVFGVPVVAFFVPYLVAGSNRTAAEMVGAGFYLGTAALLGTLASELKHRGLRAAFEARLALRRANEELTATILERERAQSALVKAEKLASLGELVAGVAHELNSPLAAIHASSHNLQSSIEHSVHGLVPAVGALDATRREALQRLLEHSLAQRSAPPTSREERARRRALTAMLEARGWPRARDAAAHLVEMGFSEASEGTLDELGPSLDAEMIARVHDLVMLQRNADNIQLAAGRAAAIVGALKRYAHPGQAGGERTSAPVADHLDTVLTLHQNQLKHAVELERDYASPGVVEARHDQLDQVWTNLVHNALQAMSFAGVLRVAVREEPDFVVAEITDSGPGIPDDVRAKIFDPFFTTKGVGEGSGLGLSICKDIVEGHGGALEVESAPGRTTFAVRLPRRRPSTAPPAIHAS